MRFRDGRLALLFPELGAQGFRGVPRRDETHVVKGFFVLLLGIAESHYQIHIAPSFPAPQKVLLSAERVGLPSVNYKMQAIRLANFASFARFVPPRGFDGARRKHRPKPPALFGRRPVFFVPKKFSQS